MAKRRAEVSVAYDGVEHPEEDAERLADDLRRSGRYSAVFVSRREASRGRAFLFVSAKTNGKGLTSVSGNGASASAEVKAGAA